MADFDVLLLDIEGTITSISFVKDILFPYIRSELPSHLVENWDSEELQLDFKCLAELTSKEITTPDYEVGSLQPIDLSCDAKAIQKAIIANVDVWMTKDRKFPELKQLQGHMWRRAYQLGKVKGHLYSDVIPSLRQAVDHKKKIFIYSSGSVEAQKLLLSYSVEGDVTELISGYFDTHIGFKQDPVSYQKITEAIGVPSGRICFCTDVESEAFAAQTAGIQAVLFVRPGNAPLSVKAKSTFPVLESLQQLNLT